MQRDGASLCFVARGIHIKGRDDFESFLLETFVGKEGEAKVADANEDDGLEAVGAEEVEDHFAELLDVVSEPARAELAEVSEILAKLSGFHASGFGERFAGDGADVILLKPLQAA